MKRLNIFIFFVILLNQNLIGNIDQLKWSHVALRQPADWYGTKEAIAVAENVLLYQRNTGGWPKNIPMHHKLSENDQKAILAAKNNTDDSTMDNGATYMESVFLAKVYNKTQTAKYKDAFMKALYYILSAQYPNGGWPQFYPLQKGYWSHITYNDDCMTNMLTLIKGIIERDPLFTFVDDPALIKRCADAFDRGVDCILKTQYRQNGKLTGWCAQHDENTLEPAQARSYELPSLSGAEGSDIVLFLMEIKNPKPEVKAAIAAAVEWFEKVKITGIRVETYTTDDGQNERRVVSDLSAPPVWARFYQLEDNRPFFCDRDGIKKYSLAEIGHERRNGYSWYTYGPQTMLHKYQEYIQKSNHFASDPALQKLKAFPGAEGFGAETTGGRGGKLLYVTRLEDDNKEGSLRWAVNQKGTRTILFKVSGIIRLKSRLDINNGDLTIAGQSAPGDGICIADHTVYLNADNIIIRYMRFRLGDLTNVEDDAIWGRRQRDIIIDHCSMSWSVDECASFYENENFTLQWCIISESLRMSVHEKGSHGYGAIWGGRKASFHHNLLAHHDSRNPRFAGTGFTKRPNEELVDFRNNVIFNWGGNSGYGGEGGNYNMVGNYYKPGSETKIPDRIFQPGSYADPNNSQVWGKYYVTGNYMLNADGTPNTQVVNNNWTGIHPNPDSKNKNELKSDTEFEKGNIVTHGAQEAYEKVLADAGASFRRDATDTRIVNEVKNGLTPVRAYYMLHSSEIPQVSGDAKTGFARAGLIDRQSDVGGWDTYSSTTTPVDTDNDGIPDQWETANGLNPNDPSDGASTSLSRTYTNLEVYLYDLICKK